MLVLWILSILVAASSFQLGTWVDSTLPKTERLLIGVGIIFAVLLSINILFPVKGIVSIVLVLIPTLFLISTKRHRLGVRSRSIFFKEYKIPLFLGTGVALGIAYAGSFPTTWYDSLLYHIPTVINLTQSPVIPGIALLHIRLASVSLPFVYSALQASLPMLNSFNFPSVFFILLLGLILLFEYYSSNRRNPSFIPSLLFYFLCIVLFFIVHGTLLFSTLAPELVLFVWSCLLIYGYLQRRLYLVITSFFLGIVTKISMVLFIPFVVLMIAETFLQRGRSKSVFGYFFDHRRRLIASVLPLAISCVYSFIVSGCFVFPIQQTCLPGKNALRDIQISDYTNTVYTWARFNPYQPEIHSEAKWFMSYFVKTIPQALWILFALITVLLIVSVFLNRYKRVLFSMQREIIATVLLIPIILVAYKTAPDFRLLWPFILSFLALYSATVLSSLQKLIRMNKRGSIVVQCLFLLIVSIFFPSSLQPPLRKSQFIYPVETIYNQAAPKQSSPFTSFSFTVPEPGDDRCGAAAFPCILDPSILSSYTYSVDGSGMLTGVYHP